MLEFLDRSIEGEQRQDILLKIGSIRLKILNSWLFWILSIQSELLNNFLPDFVCVHDAYLDVLIQVFWNYIHFSVYSSSKFFTETSLQDPHTNLAVFWISSFIQVLKKLSGCICITFKDMLIKLKMISRCWILFIIHPII